MSRKQSIGLLLHHQNEDSLSENVEMKVGWDEEVYV
jgi:hypothetical protein